MAEKKDIIYDINMVTSLCAKQDMSQKANAKKVLDYFNSGKSFKTSIGGLFLARVNQIVDGTNSSECFICKKNEAYDSVLCEDCMQKYSRGTKVFYGQEKEIKDSLDEIYNDNANVSASVENSNVKNQKQQVKTVKKEISGKYSGKNSKLAIVALVCALLAVVSPIGLIIGIIDLSKKDGRKRGLSRAAVLIGALFSVSMIAAAPDYFANGRESASESNVQSGIGYDKYDLIHDDVSPDILIKQILKAVEQGFSENGSQMNYETELLSVSEEHNGDGDSIEGYKTYHYGLRSDALKSFEPLVVDGKPYPLRIGITTGDKGKIVGCRVIVAVNTADSEIKELFNDLKMLVSVEIIDVCTSLGYDASAAIQDVAYDRGLIDDRLIQVGDYIYMSYPGSFSIETKDSYVKHWNDELYSLNVVHYSLDEVMNTNYSERAN